MDEPVIAADSLTEAIVAADSSTEVIAADSSTPVIAADSSTEVAADSSAAAGYVPWEPRPDCGQIATLRSPDCRQVKN